MTEVVVPAMTAVFLGSFASDGSADSDVGTGRMTVVSWPPTKVAKVVYVIGSGGGVGVVEGVSSV